MNVIDLPLMENNIIRSDRDCLIEFLKGDPILTQSKNVAAFEEEWSRWLGVKHSVFVNSGSSANLLTMTALKSHFGDGEVIVPPLTWVSDIASVLQNDFKPIFVDIDPSTLGMNTDQVIEKLNPNTRAVFLTHVLGFNGLTDKLVKELSKRNIPLIEDVCESHGATFNGKKCGSHGLASNFSFYYAHHMSTIEGGMICTDDSNFYETLRMLRSHGMVREAQTEETRNRYKVEYPDLNPDFIFFNEAYNVRSNELSAVIGRNQLKRLDENNEKRTANLKLFLKGLDSSVFRTDFAVDGSVNYAFTVILNDKNESLRDELERVLREAKVEFRRGLSGGGNQLRQPYLRKRLPEKTYEKYPEVEHVHFFGYYIGNFPLLEESKIQSLVSLLNETGRKFK